MLNVLSTICSAIFLIVLAGLIVEVFNAKKLSMKALIGNLILILLVAIVVVADMLTL